MREVFPQIKYGMPTISRTPECAASVAGVDMVGHTMRLEPRMTRRAEALFVAVVCKMESKITH